MDGTLPTDPLSTCHRAIRYSGFLRGNVQEYVRSLEMAWRVGFCSVQVKTLELPYDEEIRLAVTGWSGTRWGLPATEGAIGFDGVKSNSWVVVY